MVLLGAEKESELLNRIKNFGPPESIRIIPPINLRVLTELLRKSQMFIGNDSGMMHLSATVNTPVVGIFGPGNPGTSGPQLPAGKKALITKEYSCSPCRQRFFKECEPSENNKPFCLEDIQVNEVLKAVEKLLQSPLEQE